MSFLIVQEDLAKMKVDAIVNAANTSLLRGGGVCGAIFKAAGASQLQAACDRLAPIKTGEAVLTPGFKLPAKYIIHTAGPIYQDGRNGEEALLRASYLNSLKLAWEHNCESVSFPLISSGIYGYPKGEALRVAIDEIGDFLLEHDLEVYLAVLDREIFSIRPELLAEVEAFLDENYMTQVELRESKLFTSGLPTRASKLEELVENLEEPFAVALLRLIDEKGKTDVEVYKRANLDRRLFSKIRSSKDYAPSKRTAMALAVALELTIEEADDLLARAGYTFSPSQKLDVIVQYFLLNGNYDIFEINEVLFSFNQPLLGG